MTEHEMPRPWQMQLLDVLTRYLLEPEQQRAAWVMMNTVDDMIDGFDWFKDLTLRQIETVYYQAWDDAQEVTTANGTSVFAPRSFSEGNAL